MTLEFAETHVYNAMQNTKKIEGIAKIDYIYNRKTQLQQKKRAGLMRCLPEPYIEIPFTVTMCSGPNVQPSPETGSLFLEESQGSKRLL